MTDKRDTKKKPKLRPQMFNIGWTKESIGKIRWNKKFNPPNYWKIV